MPCRALPCSVPPDQTAAPRTRAVLRSLWAAGACALLAAVTMVAAGACLPQAQAAESAAVSTEHSVATLITNSDTADGSTPLRVALRLKLQPGWHTYWQNPGDAGEATAVTITAEGGLTGKTDAIQWPTPQRIRDASLMSYAYTGDVVLPLSLSLHAAKEAASAEKTSATGADSGTGAPTTLKAHASWLVCASVCVPEEADLSLPLAAGAPHPSAQTPLFEAATQTTPVPSPYTATLAADGTLRVSGQDLSPRAVKEAWFMPDKPGLIDQAAPQNEAVQNGAVELHLKRLPDLASTQSLSGILVLKDAAGSEHALYQTAKPAPGDAAGTPPRGGSTTAATSLTQAGFGQQVVFAFLGGLILNLMPCVFPILAMKALSVAKLGKAERRTQITSAGCYALGVMVTFLALGGLMMALRVAGAAEGWGFQFQSPVFVTLITWLLFGMALNLLGVFEFMPVSGGVSGTPKHGHWHDVLTGILAVVVATPCTAPFMGVAIAGALSGPPVAGLAVFAAMGLGLAAPYLLLTAIPGLAARMPRPGPWMQYLRQFLAFPLLGSCVWLLWVAALEGGASVVLLLATGMVLLSFAAWLYGVAQTRLIQQGHTRTNAALHGLALLGLLGALALIPALLHQQGSAAASSPQTSALPKGVEPFSTARFEALKAAGKPVFVDMTAAWCITCLVNERVALDVPATQQAFAKQGITVLRGDWTNHDPAISAFLKERGRDGVPLYIYSPAHGPEVTLPQILTPGLVISTLENQTK